MYGYVTDHRRLTLVKGCDLALQAFEPMLGVSGRLGSVLILMLLL